MEGDRAAAKLLAVQLDPVLPLREAADLEPSFAAVVSAGAKAGIRMVDPLTSVFVTGPAISLWSANAGIKALIDALNIVYGEKEKRGFFKLNALSLTFTVGIIASAPWWLCRSCWIMWVSAVSRKR